MPDVKVPPMEECWNCAGGGMVQADEGQPESCPECGGGGEVEQRDRRGRFLPWVRPRRFPADPDAMFEGPV